MADVPVEWLKAPVSVAEIDAELGGSSFREAWQKLKGRMRPGDTILRFESSAASWEDLSGRAGIALVRDGEAIDAIVTLMN
ncbi:hypothetical protein CWB41_05250 [Methylovirgula ligni]|uniref:Uncharacterized protein n=1 Tax=Methylovirgula ligni TaxID=569860 RepID=A0A3D9Z325_9HYPH|nr:hypothetical protein [Methylovirgula ligni]QAY95210.1 hypothetical protein CWB41_05250 [Methylovirgula ligni]REF89497.1 hypothetical protein DES32_0719 [Methylovirgula ligni]